VLLSFSARTETRPERATRDVAVDEGAFELGSERTVKVAGSPSRVRVVLRLSLRTATSLVPYGTGKAPLDVSAPR
jgi:hypothetical protein